MLRFKRDKVKKKRERERERGGGGNRESKLYPIVRALAVLRRYQHDNPVGDGWDSVHIFKKCLEMRHSV